MENKYTQYDNVVNTVMTNILVERERCGKYILYDFHPSDDADKLLNMQKEWAKKRFAADLNKEKIYLGMPLLDFIFFWKKRRKKRHNLRWLNPIQKKKISDEDKTSVSIIMDFICVQLKLNYRLFKEINDEYYGWID